MHALQDKKRGSTVMTYLKDEMQIRKKQDLQDMGIVDLKDQMPSLICLSK
jgi:hypothetical protein